MWNRKITFVILKTKYRSLLKITRLMLLHLKFKFLSFFSSCCIWDWKWQWIFICLHKKEILEKGKYFKIHFIPFRIFITLMLISSSQLLEYLYFVLRVKIYGNESFFQKIICLDNFQNFTWVLTHVKFEIWMMNKQFS